MSYSRAKYSSAKRPVPFFVWASPILFLIYLPLLWFKVIPNSFEVTDLSTLLLAALQWTAFGSLLGYLGERRFAKPRASK